MSDATDIREGLRELKQYINLKEQGENISYNILRTCVKQLETAFARLVFFSKEEPTPQIAMPKTNLLCDDCGETVKDQRALKADPNEPMYDANKPDFKCTNYNHCTGGFAGKTGWISKGWWINGKSGHAIPEEWNLFG